MSIIFIFLSLIFPLLAEADSTSTIQLPADFTGNLISQITALFGNFSPYIVLILSVLLISLVLEIIIGAIGRHH